MGVIEWIFKRKPDRPASDEPNAPSIRTISGQPVRLLSHQAIATAEEAQRRTPQLYRITNFIASSVQAVEWGCEEDPNLKAYEKAGAASIKAVDAVLKSPNDTFTPQQFLYWATLNLLLYNRAHFKVGVSTSGQPNALYPLAAKHVKAVLNNRGTVESYTYGEGPDAVTLLTRRNAEKRGRNESYAAEISFPSLSGLVEYNKMPASIESLMQPVAIVNALMQRALDTASGHPNVKYVITAEKTLTRQQKESLSRHLEESVPGDDYSGSVLFLYNTTVVVHKLDNDLKDIHSKLPLDDMTRQIAGVFGVPIALLGLGSADSAKYASNYSESRRSFWQDTITPCYLIPIAAGMTQAICPPGARVNFNFDKIPAMWADRADLGEKLSRVNFLTTDEKRDILGYEPNAEIPQVMLSSGTAISADGEPIDGAADVESPPTAETPKAPGKEESKMRIVS